MLAGFNGALLSHYFAERLLHDEFAGELGEASARDRHRDLCQWWRQHGCQLGPASGLRALWDRCAAPLAELLGFAIEPAVNDGEALRCARIASAVRLKADTTYCLLIQGLWGESLDRLWRDTVRRGIALGTPWCLCTNGRQLRLVDARRTYSRSHLEFDLERVVEDFRSFAVLWGVLRADAFRPHQGHAPLILRAIDASARHGQAVSRSLRIGVVDAVQLLLSGLLRARRGRRFSTKATSAADLGGGLDESLTIVYRILFLMFAEARGLVPIWHPIYRESYAIESLRDQIEQPGDARGLWEALQAIARLAHRGCRAGTLVVPAFNGRLFSPSRSPLAESCSVDDEVARSALLALSIAPSGRAGRARIDYRDLGVEQLGSVYEGLLDYVPTADGLRRGGDRRKTTGSFYTPQAITDYVVRRTLHPLVEHASAAEILQLRVVDPAMGSAAFLVSACRYLARAYEQALTREGACHESDIDDGDRASFRRLIAQRCLFGVDLNQTAVQLARLSLWLATLSAGKPLSFLDHHLVCGDSLIGASFADLARQPPPDPRRSGTRANVDTPLFPSVDLEPLLAQAVNERTWISDTNDDTAAIVREKEHRLHRLALSARWKAVADLWCACWMWLDGTPAPDSRSFAALADELRSGKPILPAGIAGPLLERARAIAEARRFFHWAIEFPEVYFDRGGQPLPNPGFDAVLGNPPWEMLRADSGDARQSARDEHARAKRFFRGSGIYRHQGGGHLNSYQLFVERALSLTRRGGRIGVVLPSGFATDHTAAALRRRLVHQSEIDTLTGFDNRRAIFPIHRSVRFLILTTTTGKETHEIKCRFGIDDPALLETVPDSGDRPDNPVYAVALTRSFITKLAGDKFSIPDLRTPVDLSIIEKTLHRHPRLADAGGWGVRFGRELNATEDRAHFHSRTDGLTVLEGKHIEPFIVHREQSRLRISEKAAGRLLDPTISFRRARLAYRDVASSTNKLSLIAAVLPPGVVTTHSLFCLKTPLSGEEQAYLCGLLNSFAANYLIRQVMTTHLGSTTVEQLRVPKPAAGSALFEEVAELATRLSVIRSPADAARLQALAARLYGLTAAEFEHVLGTFPLIPAEERAAALEAFIRP